MRIAIQSLEEFTPEVFRQWLAERKEDETVGQTGMGNRCPLANCLNDVLGVQDSMDNFFVAAETISGRDRAGRYISEYATSFFVQNFVDTLDESTYDAGEEVTRGECELILKSIGY